MLGAIADDLTGATDLAGILAKSGERVLLVTGNPTDDLPAADAIVVALKTRTIPAEDAVRQSLTALRWLQQRGADRFFFKYCSTFDSTPEGNIGPVADALAEALDARPVIVCPAFPANGRTIYQGHLFVGDRLLQDSSMKDHPLTPMRRSNLVELMAEQSKYTVGLLPHRTVAGGPAAIAAALDEAARTDTRYLVADAVSDEDLAALGEAVRHHPLVTGGSAIAAGLIAAGPEASPPPSLPAPSGKGRTVILSGSCSSATRAQLARATQHWPSRKLDVDRIAAGDPVVDDALAWIAQQPADQPTVVFGSADPDEVARNQQRYGRQKAGELVEDTLAAIARRLAGTEPGLGRLIVAGGETSGAVVAALEIGALAIGKEIAPGVPWTRTVGRNPLDLALKSGNFGGADFFETALNAGFEG